MRPFFHKVATAFIDDTTNRPVFPLRPPSANWFSFARLQLYDPKIIEYANNHPATSAILYCYCQRSLGAIYFILPLKEVCKSCEKFAQQTIERLRWFFLISNIVAALCDSLLPNLIYIMLQVKGVHRFFRVQDL